MLVRSPGPAEFPDALYLNDRFDIRADGDVVSWAWSMRECGAAAEVAVKTIAPFRLRGYGPQVTAAWALHVMGRGKVASYSSARGNVASQALARALGVVQSSNVAAYE